MKDKVICMLKVLPTGKENGIHQNDLAVFLGVTPRKVKKIVQTARIDYNIIICGDGAGYYFPKDKEEAEKWCKSMTKQALKRLVSIRHLRRLLREYNGQMNLKDFREVASEEGQKDEQEQEKT